MVILHRYVKLTEGMLMSNGARFKNDYIFKNVEKQWKTHGTEVDCWLSAMGGRTNNIRDWTNLFGNISLGRFTLEPTNIEANNHYPIDRRSNLIKVDLRMGYTTICIYIESLFQSLCECHETIVFGGALYSPPFFCLGCPHLLQWQLSLNSSCCFCCWSLLFHPQLWSPKP